MKKIINKFTKVLLLTVITLTNFITPISVSSLTQEEVKSTASKGDIYNPQTNTLGSTATITDHNYANNSSYQAGDVEVKKVVSKVNDNGLYNVEFFVRGKEEVVTKTKDTYIVFVIDRSYSMRLDNRWEDAKDAVIDISTELSKVSGIKMALVGFSGGKASSQKAYDDTVDLRGTFSSSAFTSKEVGDYDDDNDLGGGTNIQAGLLKANDLLKGKTGTKYVVLLSDGVPTLYYDNNGYSLGTGNSNTAEKIVGVPECKKQAIIAASTLKKNGIDIYTIGYHLNELTHNFTVNGINYDEKTLAIETLKGVATSTSHYYQSNSNSTNTLINILKQIKTDITTFKAGYNPKIIDGIGPNFKLSDSSDYGGTKTLSTSSNFEITNTWKSIGSFNINIDTSLQKGWYPTNNDFTLTYEKNTGEIKTIKCTDDPEVFWEQPKYNYKVNYYFNNNLDNTLTKSDKAYFNTYKYAKDYYLEDINSVGLTNKNTTDNTTYFLDPNNSSNTSNIKISDDVNKNVLNIYYIDTNFVDEIIDKYTSIDIIDNSNTVIPYTIEYKVDVNNVRNKDKLTTVITDTLPYEIDESKSNLNGGIYNSENKTITWTFEEIVNNFKVIHNVYKKLEYSVVYKDFANISSSVDNFLINNVNGYTKVNNKQSIGANDNEDVEVKIKGYVTAIYVEEETENKLADDTNLSGLVGEDYSTTPKDILGYSLVEEKYPQNSEGKFIEEDITVKYVYKKNNGEVIHNVTKEGLESVDSINDKFDYKITVDTTILDYVGNIKLKVIDTLPYKIDKKSIIDDRCKYDGNLEIVCEIDYGEIKEKDYIKIEDEKEFNINEEFNFELYFIDIDSENIINKVSSEIILDNISDIKNDEMKTNIPIGNVIVNYVTTEGEKLSNTIAITGLSGTSYETLKKEFDKYSFIKVEGEVKGEIKEETIEVTYIYDLTPLPPHTGINDNTNYINYILLSILTLGLIPLGIRKFKKLNIKQS